MSQKDQPKPNYPNSNMPEPDYSNVPNFIPEPNNPIGDISPSPWDVIDAPAFSTLEGGDNNEQGLSPEALRKLIHGSKYFVSASIGDTSKVPRDKHLDERKEPIGWHSLGNVPADSLKAFSNSYTTLAKMNQKYGDLDGPSATRKLKKSFHEGGIDETLTITRPDITQARVDPTSTRSEEQLVIFTYEKDATDDLARKGPFTLSICLPKSEADIFETAVVNSPQLIREAVDVVMLEELTFGDQWSRNDSSSVSGNKIALRSDFTQGPEESRILSLLEV
jgi:hypothetical protein